MSWLSNNLPKANGRKTSNHFNPNKTMSKKDLLSQCREALGDATLTNLDLLNLIGEMKKELEHDRICGH